MRTPERNIYLVGPMGSGKTTIGQRVAAILGLEFAWARTWLKRLREKISDGNARARGARAENHRRNHMDF